jgi:hypothetical protein
MSARSLMCQGTLSEEEAEAVTAHDLSQNHVHVTELRLTAGLPPGQNAMTQRFEAVVHALRCPIGLVSGAHLF